MEFIKNPAQIENRSMEIISPYLDGLNLNFEETKIFSRIIHAAGDVDYSKIIKIHPVNNMIRVYIYVLDSWDIFREYRKTAHPKIHYE